MAAAAVLGLLATTLPAAAVGSASAAQVASASCGQVVTADVSLANNLANCPDNGLVVGADGVTIDLNGRTIDGVGLGAGIMVGGHDDVTIVNGTITDFDHGVLVTGGAAAVEVTDLVVHLNQIAGVELSGAGPGALVADNLFTENALAVGVFAGTEAAVVRGNTVGEGSGHGLEIMGADGNRLEGNQISGASDSGITLEAARYNEIVGNVVADVSDAAIAVGAESDGNLIEANSLSGSDGGIVIDSTAGNLVVANVVRGMSDVGVDLGSSTGTLVLANDLRANGEGVALYDSVGNRVEANDTSDSGGTSIEVGGASFGNVLVRNLASRNGSEGIAVVTVAESGDGNLLLGNTASGNSSSGINVSTAVHTLTANVANGNGATGITVASGNIDGGGNVATGNSGSQCSGLTCNAGPPPPADTTPPDTVINGGPLDPSAVRYASFSFSAPGETVPRYECALDGGAFKACSSPHRRSGLAEGAHTFAVRSIDLNGNRDPDPATFKWTVVDVPDVDCGPQLAVTAVADAWIDQNGPGSNKGDDSTLMVRSKGPQDNFRTLVGFPLPPLPDPRCVVEVATLRLYSSGNAPGRTLQALAIAGPWAENTVTWGNQPATLPGSSSTTSGEAYRVWDVTAMATAMYDTGIAHGFMVRDANENQDAEQKFATRESEDSAPQLVLRFVPRVEVPPDTTPPETTIATGPPETTSSTEATFTFSSDDDDSTFECALDGVAFTSCSSPWSYSGLGLGAHMFAVRATDAAGNTDVTPAEWSWSVVAPPDTDPPETIIETGPPASTSSTEAMFTFDDDEDDSSFECALDGAAFTSCVSPQSYTALALGAHTFAVRATDLAGNTDPSPAEWAWVVEAPPDTDPPETTILTGPPATTSSTGAVFTFVSDEDGSTFECALDGAAFTDCVPPQSYTGVSMGAHSVAVRATDPAGNTDPSPAEWAWVVEAPPDTDPPETTILTGPPVTTSSTGAVFTFVSDEAGSTFECSLDGAAFTDCVSPRSYTGLALGEHSFRVRATDLAGNTDALPAQRSWVVETPPDTDPPETSILTGPPVSTSSTEANFTFASDEAGSTFECALDGSPFSSCVSPRSYTGLGLGAHTFAVRATDAAGNTDASPAERSWVVEAPPDTDPPETTILTGPPATTASTGAVFTFVSDEDGSTFECALDGAVFTDCVSPQSYTGVSLGAHSFAVRATDAAGNTDVSPAEWAWVVETPPDTDPPETTILTGPPATTSSTEATFAFTSSESDSTFECALDGAAFTDCVSPRTYAGLGLGAHTFAVRATDAAGNTDASPAERSWVVEAPPDTDPPETSILTGPPASTSSTEATFAFTSSESDSTFECALDGAAFTDCVSPRTYAGLGLGSHTFQVRATDAAGNTDPSPAERSWLVETPPDTDPPETTILTGPPERTASTDAVFTFGSDEGDSTFECALDGAGFTPCVSPQSYAGLGLGSHTFQVRATDSAGNTDASPAERGWVVVAPPDTDPPETTILTGPPATTSSTEATFTFTSSESGSSFECALDGAGFTACGSPVTYAGLALGAHTFQVRATDLSGNTDASPAERGWVVVVVAPPDTDPPETTILTGPPASTSSTEATFTFTSSESGSSFGCALDGAVFTACESPVTYAGLALGAHTFAVRATDSAGNTDASPAERGWSVVAPPDTDPPETTILTGPPASTSSTEAKFTFESDESGSTFECSLDTGAFTVCASPGSYTGLALGEHSFQVRAIDAAGNTDPTPASLSWSVVGAGCSASPVTVTATADSWVSEGSRRVGHGSDTLLSVVSHRRNNARSLVRFALPGVPDGCVVTSATLTMRAFSHTAGRTLVVQRLSGAWFEGSVRWTSQPSATGAVATTPSGSGARSWTVTEQVLAMYSGPNHGFVVRDASESAGSNQTQRFHSREASQVGERPTLVVTFG